MDPCHDIDIGWDLLILDEEWGLDVLFSIDEKIFWMFGVHWIMDDNYHLDEINEEWRQVF